MPTATVKSTPILRFYELRRQNGDKLEYNVRMGGVEMFRKVDDSFPQPLWADGWAFSDISTSNEVENFPITN